MKLLPLTSSYLDFNCISLQWSGPLGTTTERRVTLVYSMLHKCVPQ